MHFPPENDIARKIYTMEWLKSRLITEVGELFEGLYKGAEEVILEALASLLMIIYLVGRRAGIDFYKLDRTVEQKARRLFQNGPKEIQNNPDLQDFIRYLEANKR